MLSWGFTLCIHKLVFQSNAQADPCADFCSSSFVQFLSPRFCVPETLTTSASHFSMIQWMLAIWSLVFCLSNQHIVQLQLTRYMSIISQCSWKPPPPTTKIYTRRRKKKSQTLMETISSHPHIQHRTGFLDLAAVLVNLNSCEAQNCR